MSYSSRTSAGDSRCFMLIWGPLAKEIHSSQKGPIFSQRLIKTLIRRWTCSSSAALIKQSGRVYSRSIECWCCTASVLLLLLLLVEELGTGSRVVGWQKCSWRQQIQRRELFARYFLCSSPSCIVAPLLGRLIFPWKCLIKIKHGKKNSSCSASLVINRGHLELINQISHESGQKSKNDNQPLTRLTVKEIWNGYSSVSNPKCGQPIFSQLSLKQSWDQK